MAFSLSVVNFEGDSAVSVVSLEEEESFLSEVDDASIDPERSFFFCLGPAPPNTALFLFLNSKNLEG